MNSHRIVEIGRLCVVMNSMEVGGGEELQLADDSGGEQLDWLVGCVI